MSANRKIMVALGLVVSAAFLLIAFNGLNPAAVLDYLRQVNPLGLLIGIAVYFVAMIVIAWRWQFLLRAIKPVPLMELYQLVSIAYMGNNVYPFRAGEALRIVLLRRGFGIPLAQGTTTVVVERVFDGIVMLTFVLVPLAFLENTASEIRSVAVFAAPLFIVALAVFLFLAIRPDILRGLVAFFARFLPGKLKTVALELSEEFINGLEGLRSPRDLAGTVFASYFSRVIEAVVYWVVALAFGLNVGYPVMLIVVGAVNLVGLVPASPGQVGVFEFFASRVLMGFGVPEAQSLAYGLLVHVAIWLPPTLYGFYCLARRGLGWSAVVHAHDLEEESAQIGQP